MTLLGVSNVPERLCGGIVYRDAIISAHLYVYQPFIGFVWYQILTSIRTIDDKNIDFRIKDIKNMFFSLL